jgi:hypothetical protein
MPPALGLHRDQDRDGTGWPGTARPIAGSGAGDACLATSAMQAALIALGYSLIWRMPRAFFPGSMTQAAQAKPMSAMPSSVFSPGMS